MAERARRRRNDDSSQKIRKQKKDKRKRIVIAEAAAGVIVLGIAGYCIYDRIMDGKTMGCKISVDGVGVTWMKPEDAADKIIKEFQDTKVVFRENDKDGYTVTLGEAGYTLNRDALLTELNSIKESRDPCKILFEKSKDYTTSYQLEWDDAALKQAFDASLISGGAAREESKDAYIEYKDDTGRYAMIPSELGTVIDSSRLLTYIQDTLNQSFAQDLISRSITVEIGEPQYKVAAVTEDQQEINSRLDDLNRKIEGYENTSITYTFGSVEETISNETIRSWVNAGTDDITLDEDAMREYIYQLGLDYNTQYVPRDFMTSNGYTVTISNNEYGYWIDEEGEFEQLRQDMESGQTIKREPVYTTVGNGREGNDDLVNGYVEVSISGQYLWFYYEGEPILDSPVVTGQPVGMNGLTGMQEDWSTLLGSYPIAYTEHPSTLSSDIYGYEVEVQYWMPFVEGQGLHDASWRGAFGGSIYLTDGSHGCVNLPVWVAETIYGYVDAGFPVIVYE